MEIARHLPHFVLEVAFDAGPEPLGILGASGSGKTLTLRSIAGLENPTRGRIVLNGRVLFDSATAVNMPSRARRVALVFQNYALFPHLTVAENIAFGIAHLPKEDRRRIANLQMRRAHLTGLESRSVRELSGGEQQRVALARALATNPEALLLDEPFSALDAHLRSYVEREFREALSDYEGVVLFVTHNLEEVYRICRNLIIISDGKLAACGAKEDIFRRPPSLVAAQLTGCKNFSRARALSEHSVEALDWGVNLSLDQKVPTPLGHVGIRAHYVRFIAAPAATGLNIFPCWLTQTSESPFRMTLYLKLNTPPASHADYHVQAEVTKDVWSALDGQAFPWNVQLDPGLLFLLPH